MSSRISVSLGQSGSEINSAVIDIKASELSGYIIQHSLVPGISYCSLDVPSGKMLKTRFNTSSCPLEFLFCLSGSSVTTLKKNGKLYEYRLNQGECSVAYVPGCSGVSVTDKKNGYKVINIFVDPDYFKELTSGCYELEHFFEGIISKSKNRLFLAKQFLTKEMLAGLDELTQLDTEKSSPKIQKVSILYDIITLVFKCIAQGDTSKQQKFLRPYELRSVMTAGKLITENLISPLTVAELSKATGLNPSKLQKGFREMFGTTVYGFINTKRMEKAKLMLKSGRYSVSDTAWDLGYTNVSHFIKLFSRHYGITPGQFLTQTYKANAGNLISEAQSKII